MTEAAEATKPWFCYILATEDDSATYVGATIDPDRRLRQHNKELAGGARATGARVGAGHTWRRLCRISGFPDNHAALQFEWRLKSLGRRKELARLTPMARRIRCLRDLMALDRPTKFAAPFASYEGGGPQIHWECVTAETEFLRISRSAGPLSPTANILTDN